MTTNTKTSRNYAGNRLSLIALAAGLLGWTAQGAEASILFATKAQRLTGTQVFDADSDSNPVTSSHIYDPSGFPKIVHKAYASADRGVIDASLSVENFFSNQSFRQGAASMARFQVDDLVFSSTTLTQTTISLNLDLQGILYHNPAFIDNIFGKENIVDTKFNINIGIHSTQFYGEYGVAVDRLANGDLDRSETASGILSGLSGDNISQTLVLGNVVVPTNTAIALEFRIDLLAQGAASSNGASKATADWSASFAHLGNVFNVDPGVSSVDSASLLIQNNRWGGGDNNAAVPEPSSLVVFSLVGLSLSGGWVLRHRRRRRTTPAR